MNGVCDPFAAARAIADAVLYEGYLLYPYTASARKNQLRWQFGVVAPQAYAAMEAGEHSHVQTEVVLAAENSLRIDVLARFLRIETRQVEALLEETFVPVPMLELDGVQHLSFEEGVACEVGATVDLKSSLVSVNSTSSLNSVISTSLLDSVNSTSQLDSVNAASTLDTVVALDFEPLREIETLIDAAGKLVGRVVRERAAIVGTLVIKCDPIDKTARLFCIRARIENHSELLAARERAGAMRTAFVSTHILLAVNNGGAFYSPLDPPADAAAATKTLQNEHLWPALVGDAARDAQRANVILASPIVVGDFPQIAPQTDTNAFDGTEIDELLTLSVYALSDAERAEARATDPRARALVDRAERFDDAAFTRLHAGSFLLTESERVAPDAVLVNGVRVAKGSSVRIAPKRSADAWDMFLAGKIATVQGIQQDFEDRTYVTVTIDDDPASEYHEWYGRSFFFDTDEVEPLAAAP